MTFDVTVPNAGQSPGMFPVQNATNFARLQTIIAADHVFNDTAQATDGIHKEVTLLNQVDPVALPAGNGILYTKIVSGVSQLFWWNGVTYQQITPITPPTPATSAIKAFVNFNGNTLGANAPQQIRGSFNVSSVVRSGVQSGLYVVNFTTPLTDINYTASVTGMRNAFNDVAIGMIYGSNTYTNSVSVNSLIIQFQSTNPTPHDVLMGNVLIVSAT